MHWPWRATRVVHVLASYGKKRKVEPAGQDNMKQASGQEADQAEAAALHDYS